MSTIEKKKFALRVSPKWQGIIIGGVVALVLGGVGALLTDTQSPWFLSLTLPSFQPPGWVFPIAWSIIYLCFAASIAIAWPKFATWPKALLPLLLSSVVLNLLWCLVFFQFQMPTLAFVVILLLLVNLFALIKTTSKVSKASALWLLPYVLWVSFATVLNYAIAMLNP